MNAVGMAINALGTLFGAGGGGAGAPGSIDPATGYPVPLTGPTGPAATTPMMGSTGSTAGTGGVGLKDLLSLGSVVGKTIEAYRNYQLQQNLQDPKYIANQIAKLEQREAPALIAAEGPSIAGQYGEAGLAGAPGLIAQGISSAITPQLISDASSNYFSGLSASEGISSPSSGLTDISSLLNDIWPST